MRKVIITGLILGLVLTLGIGYKTSSYSYPDSENIYASLCDEFPQQEQVKASYNVGGPVQLTKKDTLIVGPCIAIQPKTKKEMTILYLKSWQFYANWLIFSAPLIAGGYLIMKNRRRQT